MGLTRNSYRSRKTEWKRSHRIPRYNIRILKHINKNINVIPFEGVDWIHLAHKWYALLNMIMTLRVPKQAGKFLISGAQEEPCSM
jgi:hypothetical protein